VVRGVPGAGDVVWDAGEAIHTVTFAEGIVLLTNVLCVCEEDAHLVTMLHDSHVYKLLWWNPADEAWDEEVAVELPAEWPGGIDLSWHGAPKVVAGIDTWYIDIWTQDSPPLNKLRVTDWREA